MSLRDTQELFWRAISWPTGIADFLAQADAETVRRFEQTFVETEGFPRVERMEVYADAYYWRLHGVLEEHFPLVVWLAGQARFRNLVTDYVLFAPSVDPDIRQLGARFPAFVRTHAVVEEVPALADLAGIQWSIIDVLDDSDETTVTEEAMRAIPVEQWPTLRFRPAVATRLHRSAYDYGRIVRAEADGEDPGTLALERHDPALHIAVFRREHAVYHRTLEPPEGRALEVLRGGGTFDAICRAAAGEAGTDASPQQVVEWLRRWLASSMIAAIET